MKLRRVIPLACVAFSASLSGASPADPPSRAPTDRKLLKEVELAGRIGELYAAVEAAAAIDLLDLDQDQARALLQVTADVRQVRAGFLRELSTIQQQQRAAFREFLSEAVADRGFDPRTEGEVLRTDREGTELRRLLLEEVNAEAALGGELLREEQRQRLQRLPRPEAWIQEKLGPPASEQRGATKGGAEDSRLAEIQQEFQEIGEQKRGGPDTLG
ncbi:MAG: hypothetical protein V2A76_07765, partial [Planctomycetota bacterium]